jgi:hypothetical protein
MLKYFFVQIFIVATNLPGLRENYDGCFPKGFLEQVQKTTPKITTSAAATVTSSNNKSPNPPPGFLKNSNIENFGKLFQINNKII